MAVVTGQAPAAYEAAPTRVSGQWSIEIVGLFTILLGAWGGIVPYIGPTFSYSADGTAAWTWTSAHAWLFLVPGCVAILGGLLMMLGGAKHAAIERLGSLLAILAGAWFVVGPIAWPVLKGSQFFAGYATLHQFEYWIGYSIGPGVLLVCLGGYAIGRPMGRTSPSQVAASPVMPSKDAPDQASTSTPVAA